MDSPALQMEKYKTIDRLLPQRGPNIYNAGVKDNDKGYVRYAHPSSTYPNLIIDSAIYDDDGDVIMPGYYELVLSEDRQNLLLVQSDKIMVIIPVFKVEEDKRQDTKQQPMNYWQQKKFDQEQKKQEKKKKKMIKDGKMLTEPAIYSKATIEYDVAKDYYLIMYERGRIRAWGAIKL